MIKAKGKIRQEEQAADQEALKAHEEAILKKVVRRTDKSVAGEIPNYQVVTIFADEILEIYQESGVPLDEENARDKALVLWRAVRYGKNVHAREKIISRSYCDDHQ